MLLDDLIRFIPFWGKGTGLGNKEHRAWSACSEPENLYPEEYNIY